MLKKAVPVLVLILGMSLAFPAAAAVCLPSGKPAPPFAIKSGEDQKLTLNMVLGKIVVLFYEDRNTVNKNDKLKGELIRLYRKQPASIKQEICRLMVIDCSQASFPGKSIWKKKLAEHSRSLGLTIYGDWDRQMLRDYHLRKNDSNFVIIDRNGLIRYSAAGKIRSREFQQIKALLTTLVQGD